MGVSAEELEEITEKAIAEQQSTVYSGGEHVCVSRLPGFNLPRSKLLLWLEDLLNIRIAWNRDLYNKVRQKSLVQCTTVRHPMGLYANCMFVPEEGRSDLIEGKDTHDQTAAFIHDGILTFECKMQEKPAELDFGRDMGKAMVRSWL